MIAAGSRLHCGEARSRGGADGHPGRRRKQAPRRDAGRKKSGHAREEHRCLSSRGKVPPAPGRTACRRMRPPRACGARRSRAWWTPSGISGGRAGAVSLKNSLLAAGGAVGAATLGAPYIGTAKAAGTTWKIQTSWPGGIGLQIFKDWCGTIAEKTGGELAFQPFGANDVVGDFQLYDAVKNGVLHAVNPFTIYVQGIIPAGVFLSSYPLGLRHPSEYDTFYYGLGGLEMTRELYAAQGMYLDRSGASRRQHHPFQGADPLGGGFPRPQDAPPRRHGGGGLSGTWGQDDGASGLGNLPRAGKGARSTWPTTRDRRSTTRSASPRSPNTSPWAPRASCRSTSRWTSWTSPSAWTRGTLCRKR